MASFIDRLPRTARYASIAATLLLASAFLFPFEFVGLPGMNVKKILACCGLLCYAAKSGRERQGLLSRDMALLSALAFAVSLIILVSLVYNNTADYSLATYLISIWTWTGAAYFVVQSIRLTHGHASIKLVVLYLAGVGVLQCLSALLICASPEVKSFVDAHIEQDAAFLNKFGRFYGVGAWLEPAGSKFSSILVAIAATSVTAANNTSRGERWFLAAAFVVITVVGSIMARTTLVGASIALLYTAGASCIAALRRGKRVGNFWQPFFIIALVVIPVVVILYQTNAQAKKSLRYGFEGFFSLAEKGRWETKSTNLLMRTYEKEAGLPKSIKTLVIGDGYFEQPQHDPYYMGPHYNYYMGVDMGYYRLIYYCGTLGLAAYLLLIFTAMRLGARRFPPQRNMFVLLFIVNLAVWFKGSSDLFMLTAIFLLVDAKESREELKTKPS